MLKEGLIGQPTLRYAYHQRSSAFDECGVGTDSKWHPVTVAESAETRLSAVLELRERGEVSVGSVLSPGRFH